jgi:hypothetical protein
MPRDKNARGPLYRFSNVDLDVASRADLAPLIAALEPGAFCLDGSSFRRRGMNFATFELSRQPRNPDAGIHAFVSLIESLPPTARALWNGAAKRDFNVGVEAADRSQQFTVLAQTVVFAGRVGGSITFTVYPRGPRDDWARRDTTARTNGARGGSAARRRRR